MTQSQDVTLTEAFRDMASTRECLKLAESAATNATNSVNEARREVEAARKRFVQAIVKEQGYHEAKNTFYALAQQLKFEVMEPSNPTPSAVLAMLVSFMNLVEKCVETSEIPDLKDRIKEIRKALGK